MWQSQSTWEPKEHIPAFIQKYCENQDNIEDPILFRGLGLGSKGTVLSIELAHLGPLAYLTAPLTQPNDV